MKFPFTLEQFFDVFARYNQQVWPAQIVLVLGALFCLVLMVRPAKSGGRWIGAILSLFWAWMAVVYHFLFFRTINPVAVVFGAVFLLEALLLVWFGVIRGRLCFHAVSGARGIFGWVLIGYALVIYPFLGYLSGHRYPAAPTFGLPCPTTIFTIGLLFFAVTPFPRIVLAVPLAWSVVGSMAAFKLGVVQDWGLTVASLAGLAFLLSGKMGAGIRKTGEIQ